MVGSDGDRLFGKTGVRKHIKAPASDTLQFPLRFGDDARFMGDLQAGSGYRNNTNGYSDRPT